MLWTMVFPSMKEKHAMLLAPLLVLVSVILTHNGTVKARTQRLVRKIEKLCCDVIQVSLVLYANVNKQFEAKLKIIISLI